MSAEGQISSDLIASMRTKIETALKADKVEVTDMQGDGRHVEIVVVSKEFEGQSAVNRQRQVYKVTVVELIVPELMTSALTAAVDLMSILVDSGGSYCASNWHKMGTDPSSFSRAAGHLGRAAKYSARSRCHGDPDSGRGRLVTFIAN
jgi:stress-induced morphogen